MTTLGGSTFVYMGDRYDYCYKESILSLLELCDVVSCVVVEGEDDTEKAVRKIEKKYSNLIVTYLPKEDWDAQQGAGQSKLCYFSDIAISKLNTDYNFYQQADEVISERSYREVRAAIRTGSEAFMVKRVNLWRDAYHQLNVPHERLPCSQEVIRLAKTEYRTYGDAESLATPYVDNYFLNGIEIYHYGFVRKKEVMKSKIINMQCGVFEMADYDKKLDLCEVFNPDLWFDPIKDLKIIDHPHPAIMEEWISTRP